MKRFPIGLTIAAAVAFAVLAGLGVWQVERLAWKKDLLARIAALRFAPARPIGAVLARGRAGGDVAFTRVAATCGPSPPSAPTLYRYAVRDGQVAWRLMSFCPLAGTPYRAVLLDRGVVTRMTGTMAPAPARFPAPGAVVGVLRAPGARPLLGVIPQGADPAMRVFRVVDARAIVAAAAASGVTGSAPWLLAVEREMPPVRGVEPAALPTDIPNNHLVYALTWFGLAAVLAWIYVAMVWRRMRA
ncbi:MAG: SURF1 family cytochrome oxidase biogenesis protein [Caulobacteraceae bacterium]